ncbi:unnamed protein product [Vitrella brassicaformis CCMP3155]|uniref:Eukaryotic translation initiation factor 3 subunit I n=3 Tax=Vitrella brassicaformis TaxID=1169539 RepID=A0A0G4EHP9_VITBC|nr:unnamed protein product [Vitrella brassicaformis CCMP3155]|eukprot:CEL95715.1 unnamed protein product [Vitrella brassicaformis CCMP3155]
MRPYLLNGHSRPLTYVMFNRDGDLLFTCGKDKKVNVWYSSNGERIGTYDGHNGVVWCLDVTYDSKRLITAGADECCKVFDMETGEQLAEIKEKGPCRWVQWCRKPNDQNKVVVARDRFSEAKGPAAISIWKVGSSADDDRDDEDGAGPKSTRILEITDLPSKTTTVHWGAYDETLVSSHEDGLLVVWDVFTGTPVWEIQAHDASIPSMCLSEDRYLCLTACKDASAKLWDLLNKKCVKEYKTDRGLNACSISPRYNARENKRYHILLGGGQSAEEVTTTAAGEGKFQALLYHMVFAEELGSVKGHFGPINTIAFMPGGDGYASGGEEGYVRLHHFDESYWSNKYYD